MSTLRCLFAINRDFGEYVTAQLFARGQPFESYFALPEPLADYVDADRAGAWRDLRELDAMVAAVRPHVVMLCSGYLYAVNGLVSPLALGQWLAALRSRGIAVATTDPWLALDHARPGARFVVRSVSRGGAVPDRSEAMSRLHAQLRALLEDLVHVYAVPVPAAMARAVSFFNPTFVAAAPPKVDALDADWLLVLSREDQVYLDAFGGPAFRDKLAQQVRRLAAAGRRVLFVGPPSLAPLFDAHFAGAGDVAYRPYCKASLFESALRGAAVVGYWNMLSSSLLYCLYYGVPPVFFGAGHQAQIRDGLYEHAVACVYGGHAPRLLELDGEWPAAPEPLAASLGLAGWLAEIAARHARLPAPVQVLDTILATRSGSA